MYDILSIISLAHMKICLLIEGILKVNKVFLCCSVLVCPCVAAGVCTRVHFPLF